MSEDVASLYDATVRIICDAPSHKEAVVATYRHFVGDGRPLNPDAPRWHWFEELSYGGGPIQPESGQRLTINKRRATEAELASGVQWQYVDSAPKRYVADLNSTSDTLECGRCGLRLTVNRERLDKRLTDCLQAGVSRLGLPALVAILT